MPQEASNANSADLNQNSSVDSGGEGIDFKTLFGKTESELNETKASLQKTAGEFESFKGEAKKTQDTLEKLRKALVGGDEEGGEADPVAQEIAELEAEIQEWVDAAWEGERNGKPITKTAKLAIDNAKRTIKALQKEQAANKKFAELEEKITKASDPQLAVNNALYDATDNLISNALNTIYGQSEEYEDVKGAQLLSLQRLIGAEFVNLQKNHPEDWKRVQRDRVALGKLVQHFVKKTIPPVARKLMDEDEIRRTPESFDDLLGAFREQKTIYQKSPTAQNKKLLVELRQKTWASYAQDQLKSQRNKGGG